MKKLFLSVFLFNQSILESSEDEANLFKSLEPYYKNGGVQSSDKAVEMVKKIKDEKVLGKVSLASF